MRSFLVKQTLILIMVSLLFAILIPVGNVFYIFPSFKQAIIKNAEIEAERITQYFVKELLVEGNLPKKFSNADQKIQMLKQPLNFFKMRIFSSTGTIIYSTKNEEIGIQNTKKYFHEIVSLGQKFTKVVEKNTGKTQEGKSLTIDVVETYVPVMDGDKFIGAFELYYDITDRSERFNKVISRVSFTTFAGIIILLILANFFVFRERKKIVLPERHLSFIYSSPFAPPIVIGILIFFAEGVVMLILSSWPELSIASEILLNATILLMMLVPALYFFLFRPLIKHIEERRETEKELKTAKKLAEKANEKLTEGIYEHRKTVSALKRSEQNLNRAQHISKMASWYYDWESEIEIWSDTCFKLYGINKEPYPDNIVPESLSERVYEEPKKIQDLSESLAEKHNTYELEFTTVPINGQVKTIHSYCEVERDKNGNIQKIFGTDQDITSRIEAENKLKKSHAELSTLYKLSSLINESLSLESLLPNVLKAVIQFDILNLEQKGGIFLVEEENIVLAAHLGHDKEFLELHKAIKPGVSLCGLVVQSGEMIISSDFSKDKRHTIRSHSMADHGCIIVPLKSSKCIEGVIYLYSKKDVIINDRIQNLFLTIGNQIGTMIQNAKLYKEIETLSLYDPLTGLANRRMMDIRLNELLINAKRYNKKFFVLMLDIDYFKKYNDTLGHDAGDILLGKIGTVLKKTVRESDLVARYGGEEFIIALSETKDDPITNIAERIRKIVEVKTDVTISLGVSCFREGLEIKDLIKEADTALYQAKEQGRNMFVFSG